MILNTAGRGKAMGSGKNILVFGEYRLEVMMHIWCLNGLNGIEWEIMSEWPFLRTFFI
jgi:hypothetical protein